MLTVLDVRQAGKLLSLMEAKQSNLSVAADLNTAAGLPQSFFISDREAAAVHKSRLAVCYPRACVRSSPFRLLPFPCRLLPSPLSQTSILVFRAAR